MAKVHWYLQCYSSDLWFIDSWYDQIALMVHVCQGLFLYRPIYRQYLRRFLIESIEDGISYAEARINFLYECDFSFLGCCS